jgi:ABC-2 type transport system permease protein
MATDSVVLRIAGKELGLFFRSPVAWLFLAVFAATNLFIFFWVESFFARNIADVRPLFEWMPILFIFLCSAITMRMWSEERSSGTLEHVLTQPFSPLYFVLGKFCACFTLLLLALASTLPLPFTVSAIANLDWGPVIGGYLAAMLLGAMYLAIGLFMSANTKNPVISLISSVVVCGMLYLLGSTKLAEFIDGGTADIFSLLGSGSRFVNITRGIIDLRDLFYYFSMTVAFLALNVFALEKVRVAKDVTSPRQRATRIITILAIANLALANLWIHRLDAARLDLTEGRLYSISEPTRSLLKELEEPLLIRGYFSGKTHPLLAPLAPQLRDLLLEYETAGKVKVEFIDPATHPVKEQEANERYGINSTPFRVADRHQSSLVNAYFNVLVRYGNDHKTLGFSDLLEIRAVPNQPTEVRLRNPEYDITNAIRRALFDYHAGGNLFDGIEEPVELIGYVSGDERLPQALLDYKNAIMAQLETATLKSDGKFSARFIEPESRGGAVARQIREQWGFKPMVTSPEDGDGVFFYLTLADSQQVVRLPTDDFDPGAFRLSLDAGLKRFAADFTKVVAVSMPQVDPQLARLNMGGPGFENMERVLTRDYIIRLENLSDGSVTPDADILVVVAPKELDQTSVLAIDQFLMRGGTVVLATSPFSAEISDGRLRMKDWDSGLQDWLAHHGLDIEQTLVLDEQHTSFSAPVARHAGEHEFRDMQVVDYPYFIDLRPPGLADHPVTANLPQVTMAWASPVRVDAGQGRHVSELLRSSTDSWQSDSKDIMPTLDEEGLRSFRPEGGTDGPRRLGVIAQGRFDSFFGTKGTPDDPSGAAAAPAPVASGWLERSPESARIVLFASNDFMSDRVLQSIVAASGTRYLGPLELLLNTLEWALEDEHLLGIRSRGHFNRTLPPMEERIRLLIEYINYGLALALLALFGLGTWLRGRARRRYYARGLSL